MLSFGQSSLVIEVPICWFVDIQRKLFSPVAKFCVFIRKVSTHEVV